ncbi:MAG: flavodoxin [Acidaminococcaceae bacterium]|nr:flavodoxin [Acidaminococcaceae bacterium]
MAAGCGGGEKKAEKPDAKPAVKTETATKKAEAASSHGGKKILVAYFSRTGEEYNVGVITKGNTAVVADAIAELTGAAKFEIKTLKPYPQNYRETTDIAKKELQDNTRPEIVGKPENLKDYDTVFLGYPIWWSDLPMAVYTFLESNDFNGKTIIPFCTSAGSYMTGKESRIADHAKGAKVLDKGLGLPGRMSQEDPKAVKNEVEKWLKDIGY